MSARWPGAVGSRHHRIPQPAKAGDRGRQRAGCRRRLRTHARRRHPGGLGYRSFVPAFVRIGLTGGDVGVSWLLPRIVGLGHASELRLTDRTVDVAHAARIGLANAVVAPEDLLGKAHEIAREIVVHSPFGVRLTNQVLQTNIDAPSLQAALELENRNQVLATRGRDMQEALRAFREKRAPQFTGD
jgi:enoyl-CoA hydratase/carnithine racemase